PRAYPAAGQVSSPETVHHGVIPDDPGVAGVRARLRGQRRLRRPSRPDAVRHALPQEGVGPAGAGDDAAPAELAGPTAGASTATMASSASRSTNAPRSVTCSAISPIAGGPARNAA